MADTSTRATDRLHTPDLIHAGTDPFVWLLNQVTDRLANGLMAALVAYVAIRSAVGAASKPFWFDEISTVAVTRFPSVASIWRALNQAIDSNPPLYYLIERVAIHLAPNEQLAFRLPSILGFSVALVCVFLFVKKRSGPVTALICTLVPLLTIQYTTYAEEARPYAFMVGFVALALLCYQHAPSKPWMLLMALCLATAQGLHYYAIFALTPFFIAEAALVLLARRLRVVVWLALACGPVPLLVFWPLLSRFKAYYGAHIWGSATLPDVLRTYGALFNTTAILGATPVAVSGALGVAAFVVLALSLLAAIAPLLENLRDDLIASSLFSEYVLGLGLLAVPLIVVVAMVVNHGGMNPRYALAGVLGLPLALGFVLPSMDRKTVALVAIFVVAGLAVQEAGFWSVWRGHLPTGESSALHVQNFVVAVGYPDLPVAASDGFDYMQTEYYASPAWKKRFAAIVDVPGAATYAGSDTIDRQLLVLRLFLPLQVYDFKDFVSRHPQFLLYSTGRGDFDWWVVRLTRDGYFLQVLNAAGNERVYLVSMKGDQR